MNKLLAQLLLCVVASGFFLYSYIDKQNQVTHLRIQIPAISQEIKNIREENRRLQYDIDQFENPEHLMQLARQGEFSHLKHPLVKEILTCQEGMAMQLPVESREEMVSVRTKPTLAIGAK